MLALRLVKCGVLIVQGCLQRLDVSRFSFGLLNLGLLDCAEVLRRGIILNIRKERDAWIFIHDFLILVLAALFEELHLPYHVSVVRCWVLQRGLLRRWLWHLAPELSLNVV